MSVASRKRQESRDIASKRVGKHYNPRRDHEMREGAEAVSFQQREASALAAHSFTVPEGAKVEFGVSEGVAVGDSRKRILLVGDGVDRGGELARALAQVSRGDVLIVPEPTISKEDVNAVVAATRPRRTMGARNMLLAAALIAGMGMPQSSAKRGGK